LGSGFGRRVARGGRVSWLRSLEVAKRTGDTPVVVGEGTRYGLAPKFTASQPDTANGNGEVGIDVVCPSNLFGNAAQGNAGGNIVTSGTGCARLDNNPAP